MALIAGDLHGDLEFAQALLAHRPDQVHVFLGDLVDSRGRFDLVTEMACLNLVLNSGAVLIWGNHDLAYLPEQPWSCFGRYATFCKTFHSARDRFLAAFSVDGWLCTHAGVSPKLAQLIPREAIESGTDAVAKWLNEEFARELATARPDLFGGTRFGYGPLFNVPLCRGGIDEYGGIFWFDSRGERTLPSHEVGRQIFGHTPVPAPERGWTWINLDAMEGMWVYDTVADEVLDLQ